MSTWSQQLDIVKRIVGSFLALPAGGISQQRLADFLGVTKGRVRAWENGQRPSADDLELLARKLSLSPRWLLLGEGDPEDTAPIPDPAPRRPGTAAAALHLEPPLYDPIAERVRVVTAALREAGASDEEVRRAVFLAMEKHGAPAPSPSLGYGPAEGPAPSTQLAAESSSPYGRKRD